VTPVSYYNPTEFTSPKFAYAFAKGCGGSMTDETELFPGPVALFGSPSRWPVLRQAQAEGRDWYYADHAYLGRGKYYRITKNAYQHDGRGSATSDRFRAFRRPLHSWQSHGSHILICPNSAVYFSLHGLDVQQWLDETVATLRQHTDRPIRIRWKTQRAQTPIELDLHRAWAVVVFSSAAALDALIAGVPIFTLASFAASVRMGLTDLSQIESPIRPGGRDGFLSNLCANQWTIQEILKGQAWRALQDQEPSHAAA
jgi:hypothetical protein